MIWIHNISYPQCNKENGDNLYMQYIPGILLKMQLNPHQKTQATTFHNAKNKNKNS